MQINFNYHHLDNQMNLTRKRSRWEIKPGYPEDNFKFRRYTGNQL